MKNKIYITIVSLVLILLQMTVCEYFKIYGIKPNLVLIFMVSLGVYCKKSDLFFCGVLCGILQDVLLSKSVGVYLLVNLLFCMIMEDNVNYEFDFFKIFVLLLLYDGLILLFCGFPGTLREFLFLFSRLLLGGALYNMIFYIVVCMIVKRKRKIRSL